MSHMTNTYHEIRRYLHERIDTLNSVRPVLGKDQLITNDMQLYELKQVQKIIFRNCEHRYNGGKVCIDCRYNLEEDSGETLHRDRNG